jgi:predicted MPP superfamily phosphohydrolase
MTGSGPPLVISRIWAIICACSLTSEPGRKSLKPALSRLYWQLCQYPWHLFFNVGVSGLLYLLSLAIGPRLTRSFTRYRTGRYPIKYFFADRVLTCVVGTMLLVLGAVLVVRENNVVFIIMGINYFFWFLFFPLHLLGYGVRRSIRSRRIEFAKILLAAAIFAVAYFTSFYFPEHVIIRRERIETDRLTSPIRIVHLSDIHCERYGAREQRVAAAVNRLKPDFILISGDIYNAPREYNRRGLAAARELLRGMKARYGTWAVCGHHDIYYNEPPLTGDPAGGIRFLNNATANFSDSGLNLSLSGVKAYNRDWYYIRDTLPGAFRIFIAHQPSWIEHLKTGDFDLALFGHTHAGQVYLPIVTPALLGPYVHGWYHKNGVPFNVHAGLGMDGFLAPRIRWFTFPEIVVIDIVPAQK